MLAENKLVPEQVGYNLVLTNVDTTLATVTPSSIKPLQLSSMVLQVSERLGAIVLFASLQSPLNVA
jgi:hypothetical protein